MRHRVEAGRWLAGIHCRGAIDYIGVSAPRPHDLLDGFAVKLAGDVEVEVALVGLDGRLKRAVEVVGIVIRSGHITKSLKVLL